MVSCAKRHLRVNRDAVFSLRHIFVKRAGNDAASVDHERLEIILFPLLVPVLIFSLDHFVADGHFRQRKLFNHFAQCLLVVKRLLNVAVKLSCICQFSHFGCLRVSRTFRNGAVEFVGMNKTFETYFGQHSRQYIVHSLVRRLRVKRKFQVLHSSSIRCMG